jgi:serine protease AprX
MSSEINRGLSWDGDARRRWIASILVLTAVMSMVTAATTRPVDDEIVPVVLREVDPSSGAAEALVVRLGGRIVRHLELVGGFSATIPRSALATVGTDPSVASVTPDGSVTFTSGWQDNEWEDDESGSQYDGHSVYLAAYAVYAKYFWQSGFNGQGVDVALIDTGVAPVNGLTYPGKVVNGADLSFESQADGFRHLDTYGHGTHMAGIIAGRDNSITYDPSTYYSRDFYEGPGFIGIAPGARIVNVKVGDREGATDVSQVIAAIDWVVQNRNRDGLNIRVLNLSFGTDSVQDYRLDPLAYAVQQAWKSGIVVVVSAGNDGGGSALRNPANNPFVIAVGSTDMNDTYSQSNDALSTYSNCPGSGRTVDLVAPGQSIRSLRVPGGTADLDHPTAAVDGRFFKGSGTSQAAAVVSGAAALVISQRPSITPDQVKALLVGKTAPMAGQSSRCQGAGQLNLRYVRGAATPTASQSFTNPTGLGTLEGSRGTDHLSVAGVTLLGEMDIFGRPFSTGVWAPLAAAGSSWSAGDWNGSSWSGSSWSGSSWSGRSWSGRSWSGSSWSGSSWSSTTWSDKVWTGSSWSGSSWSGSSWSGSSWSGSSWSGQRWE